MRSRTFALLSFCLKTSLATSTWLVTTQTQAYCGSSYQMHTTSSIVCVLVYLLACAHGFYLPGVSEVYYKVGTLVPLQVNKLTSVKTQIPYKHYYLNFCKPKKEFDKKKHENLGEILRGDRIESSVYEVRF